METVTSRQSVELDEADIVTACYLCHGQCVNFGVHGNGVRPCARGVNAVLERCRRGRGSAVAVDGLPQVH